MTNDMGLTPTSLEGLAGGPFTQIEVDAAVAKVRSAAGWHIAPVVTETVTLDVDCWEWTLRLPTKKLVSVNEVRDTRLDVVLDAARYQVSKAFPAVHKCGGVWPYGYGRIDIAMTHGFDDVPADLLPVIAEAAALSRRDQTAEAATAGPYSYTFGASDSPTRTMNPLSTAAVLERYSLFQMGMA